MEMLKRNAIKVIASADAAVCLRSDVVLHERNCTRGAVAAAVFVDGGTISLSC